MAAEQTVKGKVGTVIRRSGDQSVIVRVERMVQHPRVKKYVRRQRNFHVHDPKNVCAVGDEIVIREGRPISKTKRWVFASLIKREASATGVEV